MRKCRCECVCAHMLERERKEMLAGTLPPWDARCSKPNPVTWSRDSGQVCYSEGPPSGGNRQVSIVWENRMRRGLEHKSLPEPEWLRRCIFTQAGSENHKSKYQIPEPEGP